jgi:hypothetical protein
MHGSDGRAPSPLIATASWFVFGIRLGDVTPAERETL